jgi:putative ABC transport system ATP-binding protein
VTLLELSGVTKRFGRGDLAVTAVSDVDLTVDAGETVVIMGPSGSGKSTLLQLIGALMTPTEGTITLAGHSVSSLTGRARSLERLRRIGFVFQSFNLVAALSALQNVELPARLAGTGRRERRDRAEQLLGSLGLAHRLHHRPSELSGGEQQRVAIARALVNDPPLVIADEPTASLDSASGYQVIHLLEDVAITSDKTVLVATHDHRITGVASRLLWLTDGTLAVRPADFETATDPVCGMEIIADRAATTRRRDGRTVYLCSHVCADRYDADPDRYPTPATPDEQH